jgi:hypothetical protein
MSAISEVLDALRVCSDAFEHKPTKKLAPTIVSHDHIVIDELVAKRFRGLSIAVSTRQDQERRTRSGHTVEQGAPATWSVSSFVVLIALLPRSLATIMHRHDVTIRVLK